MTRWSPAGIWEFSIIAEFEIIIEMKFTTARILKRLDNGQPLENAIKTLQKVVDVRGMGKK